MGDIFQLHRPSEPGTILAASEAGVEISLGGGETLWLGELAAETLEARNVPTADLGGDGGWWIVHYHHGETTIVGKLRDHILGPPSFQEILARFAFNVRSAADAQIPR